MSRKFTFNRPDISDKEIIDYINQRENIITISFISPYSDIPHMCPVWGIFHDGKFIFQTDDYSAKVKAIEKGNHKIGVSIANPKQYPELNPSEGSILYISFGGTATIRTRTEFKEFEDMYKKTFLKYIEDQKERAKITKFVLEEIKTRVFIEVTPEWIKTVRVPKTEK
jgi:hypothetical protein